MPMLTNGDYLDHKYNNYVDENNGLKNNNPNATDAEKAKSYTRKAITIATEITIGYLALDEIQACSSNSYKR